MVPATAVHMLCLQQPCFATMHADTALHMDHDDPDVSFLSAY